MSNDQIVEVYAAGNAFEAHELRAVLEEAGIQTVVVGDYLSDATGWAPHGQSLAPRIWVRRDDEIRARAILAENVWSPGKEEPESEDDADQEVAEQDLEEEDNLVAEEEAEAGTLEEAPAAVGAEAEADGGSARWAFLGQGFMILGGICVVLGLVQGWRNATVRTRFSESTEATLVGWTRWKELAKPRTDPSFQPDLPPMVTGTSYDLEYAYSVDGARHLASLERVTNPRRQITVFYDPKQPAENVVDLGLPPWLCMVLGAVTGAFLGFVGYKFSG
jgi:hypothetical protein